MTLDHKDELLVIDEPGGETPQKNHAAGIALALGLVGATCFITAMTLAMIKEQLHLPDHPVMTLGTGCSALAGFPLAIVGLVLAAVALRQIKKGGGRMGGRRMALAGLIVSLVALLAYAASSAITIALIFFIRHPQ